VGRERIFPYTEGHERVPRGELRDRRVGGHQRFQRDGAAPGIRNVFAVAGLPAQSEHRLMDGRTNQRTNGIRSCPREKILPPHPYADTIARDLTQYHIIRTYTSNRRYETRWTKSKPLKTISLFSILFILITPSFP